METSSQTRRQDTQRTNWWSSEGIGVCGQTKQVIKRYKLPATKINKPRGYNVYIGNRVNNIVTTLAIDGKWGYCGDYVIIFENMES